MDNYTMIRDVGETLKNLLKNGVGELGDESRITFDSPADIEPASQTKLSIFLYQLVQNEYMRNSEPEPLGRDRMREPPLILDLYYLFTPYAANRETELIILENLMQFFHGQAALKGEMLQGKLAAGGNTEIRVVPHNFSFDEINKLWERFPNKPFKLSCAYMLTPLLIPSVKEPYPISRVKQRVIDLASKETGPSGNGKIIERIVTNERKLL